MPFAGSSAHLYKHQFLCFFRFLYLEPPLFLKQIREYKFISQVHYSQEEKNLEVSKMWALEQIVEINRRIHGTRYSAAENAINETSPTKDDLHGYANTGDLVVGDGPTRSSGPATGAAKQQTISWVQGADDTTADDPGIDGRVAENVIAISQHSS